MKKIIYSVLTLALSSVCISGYSQTNYTPRNMSGGTVLNNLLMVTPDSRSGGMGDVGVATSPDIYSQHWNPAKYAFIEEDAGFAMSYVPWNRKLVNDEYLIALSGFKRVDRSQSFGFGLKYSSLGLYDWTDYDGNSLGSDRPSELSVDASYTRMLSDYLSAAVAFRYLRYDYKFESDVAKEKAGGFATDVALFYNRPVYIGGNYGTWAFGFNLSNIGPKMRYLSNDEKRFIPTNLRLGTSIGTEFAYDHEISFSLDFNKLLVPTPPIRNINDPLIIEEGKDDNVSSIKGIFQSFGDAPGGFSEELKEIGINCGAEYWYKKTIAVRTGYAYQDAGKGYQKYFAMGVGARYNNFGLDLSYLTTSKTNPLAETLRFSFLYMFAPKPNTAPASRR